MAEWCEVCPADCDQCDAKFCKGRATVTLRGGLQLEPGVCPRRVMDDQPEECNAVWTAIEAWRHWKSGNLACRYQEPSEALMTLILWVDDEVNARDARLIEEARRE